MEENWRPKILVLSLSFCWEICAQSHYWGYPPDVLQNRTSKYPNDCLFDIDMLFLMIEDESSHQHQ